MRGLPLVAVVAALALAVAAAPTAVAGPVSAEARARAETAFLDGRLDDLDAALGAGTTLVDAEPIALRDLWWRPRAGYVPPSPAADDTSLSARRLRWLADPDARRATPYPTPAEGETDAYPRLAVLVADRVRREARGAAGLPEASPLWTVEDETTRFVWRWWGTQVFVGPRLEALEPEDRRLAEAAQARFERVVARNRALAVGAVIGFVVAAGLASWRLRGPSGHKSGSAPTEP